jgi:ribose transport system substrate-binding protein
MKPFSLLRTRRSQFSVGFTALTLVITLSSAGQAATTAPTGVKAAVAAVARQQVPVAWRLTDAPKVNVGTSMRGKLLYFIPSNLSLPFVQSVYKGVTEAATAIGMKSVAVNAAGQPSKAADAIQQAIAQHAAVIVLESLSAEVLAAPIRDAKAAGIPVIEMYGRDPALPTAALAANGVSAIVSSCYACAGREMAQSVVADAYGAAYAKKVTKAQATKILAKKITAVVFQAPGIGVSKIESDAFVSEMKRLCRVCGVKVVGVPISQWATQLPATTAAQVMNPAVNYLVPVFDGAVPLMVPVVFASGAQKDIRIVTFNASLPAMQELQKKNGIVVTDVGAPEEWSGWATVDQAVRAMLHQPVLADEKIGDRTFNRTNIRSVNLTGALASWFGNVDFASKYKALWGIN